MRISLRPSVSLSGFRLELPPRSSDSGAGLELAAAEESALERAATSRAGMRKILRSGSLGACRPGSE